MRCAFSRRTAEVFGAMTRTMNETETRELIAAGKVGHLGCVVQGEPYVVPINYLLEGDSVYGHSMMGQKIEALRNHPRACLEVNDVEGDLRWRSAIVFGDFEEIHQEPERAQVMRKLLERYPLLTPVESVASKSLETSEVIVFRIRVDRLTGLAED
jgi:nitroimidazol reductase NimA-like FMN-containing flavoprotein (pyridoxamine 5'-phosphate oxidase superfamily)